MHHVKCDEQLDNIGGRTGYMWSFFLFIKIQLYFFYHHKKHISSEVQNLRWIDLRQFRLLSCTSFACKIKASIYARIFTIQHRILK